MHIMGILVSLFTNLASDTAPRIRLIAKFVEENYEKVDRLLELRETAQSRIRAADLQIAQERKVGSNTAPSPNPKQDLEESGEEIDDDRDDEWYLTRLDAGLSALQSIDYVLAWVCMEDDGVSSPMLDCAHG